MPAKDKAQYNSFRVVLTVISVFALVLAALVLITLSGADIPFFSNAYHRIANGGQGGGPAVASGASGALQNAAPKSASGALQNAAPESDSDAAQNDGQNYIPEPGSENNSGAISDSAAGIPYELKGSGGAWDGTEIIMPYLSLSYDANEETEFCLYREFIAECSRDSFSLLDKNGAEAYRKSVDFMKPSMRKRGNYLLVCDLGGRSAFVMKGAKPVWEDTAPGAIVNASINESGYIAFVLDAIGYRNSVRVLAPIGKPLFDWIVADDYVIGSEVAPSGGELVINRLKTSGISLGSGLEFLDMKSEPFRTIDSGNDEVFLDVRYLEDNSLAVASENMFFLYSDTGATLAAEEFDVINAMCEFPRKKAVIAAQRNNRALLMEFDAGTPGGRAIAITGQPVYNLSADDGYLFVNFGNEIMTVRENGKTASALTLDSEALYGGASEKIGILVVTKKSADLYAVK